MRRIEFLGPSLVVLAAAGVLLFIGPTAVRQVSQGMAASQMSSAHERLQSDTLLDQMSKASRDVALLVEPSVVHVSSAGVSNGRGPGQSFINSGSGWIYDATGHIVTNAHVVEGATRLEVQLFDGERREAKLRYCKWMRRGLDLPNAKRKILNKATWCSHLEVRLIFDFP